MAKKNANTNPMGITSGRDKVDQGAVRLARKKAQLSIGPLGTNTKAPGVSLNRPTAKSAGASQPSNSSYKSQPAKPSAAKLNRPARTK